MFNKPTAFILGAGASAHYGYPTGEQLIKEVIAKANFFAAFCKNIITNYIIYSTQPEFVMRYKDIPHNEILKKWQKTFEECQDIETRLQLVDPLVIDFFLQRNEELSEIGRFLIAWVILECELRKNGPIKENWCRFISNKLIEACEKPSDILNNKVSFITFNYDISLEKTLYTSLNLTSFFSKEEGLIDSFFDKNRFLHVYGQVRQEDKFYAHSLPYLENINRHERDSYSHYLEYVNYLNFIYSSSKNLKVINDKHTNKEVIDASKQIIANAENIYILGYGFDKFNSNLIGLGSINYYDKYKWIMFTNFEDKNQINKRASKVFFNNSTGFSPGQSFINQTIKPGIGFEKSIRKVHDALSLDFDFDGID